jgi:DNA-binding protein HU-beta
MVVGYVGVSGHPRCGAEVNTKGKSNVNKSELIEAVAAHSGQTKADTGKVVESLIDVVSKTLKKGDDVAILGFGKFSVSHRAARAGRNPATGAPLKIKASKTPKFSAGAALKQAVSGRRK